MVIVLLLASRSRARQRLLSQAGIAHQVMVSGFDEGSISDEDPKRLVSRLAAGKAWAVVRKLQSEPGDALGLPVLACDSVLEFEGKIFGKPADAAEAIRRWQRMAGGCGELHTGHCLITNPTAGIGPERRQTVTTVVHFARLTDGEIRAYVASGEPLQCAGGFALEGRGGCVVERIDGCLSNAIGLSLPLLRQWLPTTLLSQ